MRLYTPAPPPVEGPLPKFSAETRRLQGIIGMTKSVTSIMQGAREIYAADIGVLICAVLLIVGYGFSISAIRWDTQPVPRA